MNKKIIIPKSTFSTTEFSNHMKDIYDSFKSLSEINKEEKQLFFDEINSEIKKILDSKKSYIKQKKDLILFKQTLQLKKSPNAKEYEIKRIDEVINLVINPAIDNLSELILLEKDHSMTNDSKPNISDTNLNITNTELDRLNSNLSELKLENETPLPTIKLRVKRSKEEVRSFFMKLAVFKNELNNKPYLPEKEVEQLLAQGFEDYSKEEIQHRLLDLNLTNKQFAIMYTFIYQFYSKSENNRAGTKKKYAYFLKDNFTNFNHLDIDTLYSSIRLNNQLQNSIDLLKKNKS